MSKSSRSEKVANYLQKQLTLLQALDWYKNHNEKWVKKLNTDYVSHAWVAKGILKY